jgi:phage terminase Nu1 subunit (DNA packaging protein)
MLKDLTERVLSGELETGRAAVANQLINTRLRAIEQERKVRELEDVLVRIEALEEKQRQSQPMKGARRW